MMRTCSFWTRMMMMIQTPSSTWLNRSPAAPRSPSASSTRSWALYVCRPAWQTPTPTIISCNPEFYPVKLVEYGKMCSLNIGGNNLCVPCRTISASAEVFVEKLNLFADRWRCIITSCWWVWCADVFQRQRSDADPDPHHRRCHSGAGTDPGGGCRHEGRLQHRRDAGSEESLPSRPTCSLSLAIQGLRRTSLTW